MKIMAIESSGLTASVAVIEDEIIRAEYTTDEQKTHSETLLPMLDEICGQIGLNPETVDAVAVSSGPGSFTGLRIGSATAKGIALALELPLVEVSTLEGLAYNLVGSGMLVCPIMDARRKQVYNALFRFDGLRMERLSDDRALAVSELLSELETKGDVIFCGDGIAVYREEITERLGEKAHFAPPHLARQRAASIAALGLRYFREGRAIEGAKHVPSYLRKSQAEREREQKNLLEGDRS